MSPMGSQRNFASPSLAKRMALQHLNPPLSQDLNSCQKNIWNNPLHSLKDKQDQEDISYLYSLQAQNFPHLPNHHLKEIDDHAITRNKKNKGISETYIQTRLHLYYNAIEYYIKLIIC